MVADTCACGARPIGSFVKGVAGSMSVRTSWRTGALIEKGCKKHLRLSVCREMLDCDQNVGTSVRRLQGFIQTDIVQSM